MAKILVTGAAGFMGSHLVDSLLDMGYDVYSLDDLSWGYKENVNPKSTFIQLDLQDKQKTENYINDIKPEYVFHLAADATEGRSQFTPINSTQRNYGAYLNLLVPSIKNGMKKMILTSSMSVYGAQAAPFSEDMERSPEDIYAISKAAMEHSTEILSKVFDFKYTIIRPHNVYGPRQNLADPYRNVIAIFINRLLQGKNFYIYGTGEQKRSFSYIDDFTPYIVKAGFDDVANGEIFNIGPVEECTINQLGDIVLSVFFPDGNIPENMKPQHIPPRPLEVADAWCTAEKAEKLLGYKTSVTLKEGITKMIEWARSVGPKDFHYLDNLELVSDKTPDTWTKKLL